MSHFTKVKTGLKDIGVLRRTLAKIGWACVEAREGEKASVKGWDNRGYDADLKFNVGCSYEIGVNVDSDGELRLEADWWAIETFTQRTRRSLMDELTREYAYVTVMDKAHELGYEVVEEKAGADSEVRLLLRKW